MQALKDGLLVGPFISEFCSKVTDKCLSMNRNVLHKCVSSGDVVLIQAALVTP